MSKQEQWLRYYNHITRSMELAVKLIAINWCETDNWANKSTIIRRRRESLHIRICTYIDTVCLVSVSMSCVGDKSDRAHMDESRPMNRNWGRNTVLYKLIIT